MFKKVLIANRGEIAVRIIRSCIELGIKTVAIHSIADNESMHVKMADESICIGGAKSLESYLNIPAIITAAELTGAEAIHPGYGFLSENYKFVRILEEHNITFIGPSSKHIEIMGDKVSARKVIKKTGIPIVPGTDGPINSVKDLKEFSKEVGFPLIIKASAGGGGKGMKVVYEKENLEDSYNLTKSEAEVNFGNDQVYAEKFLTNPKHIEFQIFSDNYQNVIHLGERDCSIQRRHQKLIEEAPAFKINKQEKNKVLKTIIKAMKDIKYRGAGTIEMLYEDEKFYFIEMNTRLQVEHPVTEMITGVDIVAEQIKAASGAKLKIEQSDIEFKGHSIECRINAEDPKNFNPSPGKINTYHQPGGNGVRVDACIYNNYNVVPYYDSLIGKLIVHSSTRAEAVEKMKRALNEFVIDGINTTVDLHKKIISSTPFNDYKYSINWLEDFLKK